jgi:hypothetical protein
MPEPRDWHSEPETPETLKIGQPDPALQQTQAGPLRLTIYALGSLAVLGLVLYGLNQPHPQNEINAQSAANTTAATPAQQPAPSQDEATKGGGPSTTGSAPQGDKPQDNKAQPKKAQGNQDKAK